MSSSIAEPAVCKEQGHGLMVPCKTDFALIAGVDGAVVGTVEWDKPADHMTAQGYAMSKDVFDAMALLDSTDMGEKIYAFQQEGLLVDYADVAAGMYNVYRIDDRTSNNWGYMIQLGAPTTGSRLLPGAVYHYFGDEDEEHGAPWLTEFDEVRALMDNPSALLITHTRGLAGKSTEDPEVKEQFSLDDRIVVWDIGAIYRQPKS